MTITMSITTLLFIGIVLSVIWATWIIKENKRNSMYYELFPVKVMIPLGIIFLLSGILFGIYFSK